jgi:hypothetical protein
LFVNDDTIDQNAGSIDWTALVTENDEIVSYAQTGVGTATGVARGDYAFHAPKQDPEVANDPALITTSKAGTAAISTFISVEWDASGDNADHEFRVALQIDGIWYASNPAQNDGVPDSGGTPEGFNPMSFAPESFATASNWLVIENAVIGDPDPLSLGAAPEADLTGTVTAYGLYVVPGVDNEIDGDHIRFDNFTIEVVQVVDVPTLMVEAVGSDLVFSWDSEQGKLYNLRSDTGLNGPTSEWPIYADHMEIVATPPMNMLTIPRPADPAHFFVIEEFNAPPAIALSDDFESGIGNWQVSSTGNSGTDWQLGAPTTVGPTAANSGTNCFGTNISSEYAFGADVSLRSEPVDLTSAAGATLSFNYYLDGDPNPDGAPFDTATVSLLDSSDNVLEVLEILGNEITANWTPFTAAVPASALGQMVKVEFRFVSDGIMNAPGWYIDDVQITVP